jgi:DNA-directed RNA polymerase I subunit RPA2
VSVCRPQDKGLTIVAENINRMRYMSHFRSVHRGSFFQEMRTTEARQLLPDAWGFICPVHTPDGTPCGLLNHLGKFTQITDAPDPAVLSRLPEILTTLGMVPVDSPTPPLEVKYYNVLLDGRLVGYLPEDTADELVNTLRMLKLDNKEVSEC